MRLVGGQTLPASLWWPGGFVVEQQNFQYQLSDCIVSFHPEKVDNTEKPTV